MAKSTVSITLKLHSDGKGGFKELAQDADGLRKMLSAAVTEAEQLNKSAINFAAIATGLNAVGNAVGNLQAQMKDLADAYAIQEEAERKLETTMRNSMNATDEEIQGIKDLASAQQELGIIGDEVQLAGAQELATYLELSSSLEKLIPVLNDMNAQQYGLAATTESSVTIATMLGKVMQGQTKALSRYGYSFDEAQEKVLKFGNEEERAAMLAEVVSASVGGVNAALAQTDSGKQQQLVNTLGDLKEQLGSLVVGALPFVTIVAQTTMAATSIMTLTTSFKALIASTAAFGLKAKLANVATLSLGLSAKKSSALVRVLNANLKTGAYQATAFKLALRGLMVATGVGIAIAAVTKVVEHFSNAADEAAEKERELAEETKNFKREISDISATTAQYAEKEVSALDRLYNIASDETKSRKERANAIKELQRIYPAYFKDIDAEKIKVKELESQYDNLRTAILKTAKARAAEDKLKENAGKLIEIEEKLAEAERKKAQATKAANKATAEWQKAKKDNEATISSAALGDAREMGSRSVQSSISRVNKAAKTASDANKALSNVNDEIAGLIKQQAQINESNDNLAKLIEEGASAIETTYTPTGDGGGKKTEPTKPSEGIIGKLEEKIAQARKDLREATTKDDITKLLKQIADWEAELNELNNPTKTEEVNAKAQTLEEIEKNIEIINKQIRKANVEQAAALNAEVKLWQAKADAIRNAGNAVATVNAEAVKLKDIEANISVLQDRLQDATAEQAAALNKEIKLWQDKADAIRNAGKEAEKTASAYDQVKEGWGAIKGAVGAVTAITEALQGNRSAWEAVVTVVDSLLSLYDSVTTIISIIQALTAASAAHAATKTTEAVAEGTAAGAREAAAATNTAAAVQEVIANKLATASFTELAAAQYMAAHAYIPFAGFGIAAGFTASMLAAVTAAGIPALAEGGIASGPTLALVGEYGGASGNPEVIAPLDKLRKMLAPAGGVDLRNVEFKIKGRTLVAILDKEINLNKRS